MNPESLWAIIILLIGAHYGVLVYRLHKVEEELSVVRRDFASAAIAAAQAAAQAATVAMTALKVNGNGAHK